jgi:hypothetical protein
MRIRMPEISGKLLWVPGLAFFAALIYIVVTNIPNTLPIHPDPGNYVGEDIRGQPAPRTLPGSYEWELAPKTELLSLKNAEIGKAGLGSTPAFEISAVSTSDRIYIELLTADRFSCPRLVISDTNINKITFLNIDVDGYANVTSGGTPSNVLVGTRGARSRTADATSYDKIIWKGNGANAEIKTLELVNVHAYGGDCDWSGLEIGHLYIANSQFGTGDGINVNDFGFFGSSVTTGTVDDSGVNETEVDIR